VIPLSSRNNSKSKSRSKSNKKEIKTNIKIENVKTNIPNTTNNCNINAFRKNNIVKEKLDIKKLHEHKTNEVNTATGKRFGSFLNKVKDEPPKAVCKDIETLQKHNLLIDTKLNTELSLLKEKLKNIDNDNRSCKTNKKNNSSLILQTNETEKISSNVDTQINTQNKLFEDNTSKQKKTFVNT